MQNIVYLTPNFAVTSAPAPEDFAEFARLGFKSVLSNRPEDEEQGQLNARQSAKLAWTAGLRYRHVPTAKHDVFTDEVVEGMADALVGLPGPVLAHCKSGLRSAIVWAAASARSQSVDCVLEALSKGGFELDFLRDDLDAQADRARWLPPSKALDCECDIAVASVKTGTKG